jgi:hypothetical protein
MTWVETLSKDDTNPAFRLMSSFQNHFKHLFKMPVWKTEKTMGVGAGCNAFFKVSWSLGIYWVPSSLMIIIV